MKTPIYDFLKSYRGGGFSRFHMPGHKGIGKLGIESLDITEINGADVLYSPKGIILESENNATSLFGSAHSYYSTEGSTLAIKAMLALALRGKKTKKIIAARNAHKAFIYASVLLDFDTVWVGYKEREHITVSNILPEEIIEALSQNPDAAAVYITSPDYLGNTADIAGIAEVCKTYGKPLLVDNAHGAYLAFLKKNRHPITLGAAMACDSAHKTLPVLTGGAYLHISKDFESFCPFARDMLSLFASTSPSYLTLASLDLCNAYLDNRYKEKLEKCVKEVGRVKSLLSEMFFAPEESEPLKIVINTAKYGYRGEEIAAKLTDTGVIPEFYDRDYTVFMATPENTVNDFRKIVYVFANLKPKTPLPSLIISPALPERKMSAKDASFSDSEIIYAKDAEGRILASPSVSCPPAVPIAVMGEVLNSDALKMFEYYGIEKVAVVCE